MTRYDLCLAWNWEYDADFVAILEAACLARGLSLWQVTPANITAALETLSAPDTEILSFLDRASEAEANFIPFVEWAAGHGVFEINPHERALHAVNKASMHLEFITAGIHTPHTIILPPYSQQTYLSFLDLSPLGGKFIVKPAHGGGGEGVVLEVSTLGQVLEARQAHPQDYYLLQAHISPVQLAGRPAWFRVLFCGGRIYPFWWEMASHVYVAVEEEEDNRFGLGSVASTTRTIAQVCGLNLFSTEIALTASGHFVVVDYVNNPIDLRLQSATPDGVPDETVRDIAGRLAELVFERRAQLPP
ncbi:MAG: hypothetical protein A2028_02705 [Candidatus Aminicenantes bacterium RBG_19FT_COMBO_59_29]|nr:MAG: hypothetical protein A2028_02705 [Candidatus Aminicenantes bacterium RBG_19FT_COMBO_59_29]